MEISLYDLKKSLRCKITTRKIANVTVECIQNAKTVFCFQKNVYLTYPTRLWFP